MSARRSRLLRVTALALTLSPAALASAQERTGPRASPPPLPAYPQASPGLPSEPQRTAPETPPAGPGVPLREIRVAVEGPAGDPRPPSGWRPPEAQGFRLDHRPDERLDEAWVRRQFELNGLPGPSGGVAQALALVQLINRAYLGAGFINSGVVVRPAARPGELELRVLYGGLSASAPGAAPLEVTWAGGAKGLTERYVRERMPAAFQRPLSAFDLERDFRLLAEDPALRTVNAELRPGSRPGEASLGVRLVPQDRYDLYVTAANNRSPTVGGERLAVAGSVRNVLVAGSVLSAEAGWTEGVEDISLNYSTPFLSPRTTLSIRGAYNNAAVIDTPLVPLDIEARDRSVEVGLTRKLVDVPLLPTGEPGRWASARTLSTGVLVIHREGKTFLLGEPFSFSPGSVRGRSKYTAIRAVGDYVVRNVDQVMAVSITGTMGLDGTRSDIPGLATPKQTFMALLAQVNYARRLSDDGLELRARLSGQVANSILYSGERFSAGGETTVRGYRENLILADNGLVGSVEIARPLSFARGQARSGGFTWDAFTVSAFADGAYVRNDRPPHPKREIYSVGASLAWTPSEALSARVTYGHALNKVELFGSKDLQDDGLQVRIVLRPLKLLR
ncbi:ShlB/FhaC/HecB family hemolysin secretion/activation protein [Phenylobacterium kunshanense]|uniref:Haemolysin activator HlyB C-terminal domain-containing protein n=1 Tax=Phenylobacterium kunshanense TaxID=1445034 RepID=A0A328B8P2_9CAUL|nr:ShlB/FhaC/HecB family hemolysin secretion/activation protein [Phenylobacterium kunshanense]RAK62781.1 hypothetical protein DJ019_18155 [Phenylobacterium kunshanense]